MKEILSDLDKISKKLDTLIEIMTPKVESESIKRPSEAFEVVPIGDPNTDPPQYKYSPKHLPDYPPILIRDTQDSYTVEIIDSFDLKNYPVKCPYCGQIQAYKDLINTYCYDKNKPPYIMLRCIECSKIVDLHWRVNSLKKYYICFNCRWIGKLKPKSPNPASCPNCDSKNSENFIKIFHETEEPND